MPVPSDRPFVVSGAGIAGLTAALQLANRGYSVQLLEKKEGFETTGAGIQLSPNAMAVFRDMGLDATIGMICDEPRDISVRTLRSDTPLSRIRLNGGMFNQFVSKYRVVKRSSLHSLLLSHCQKNPFIELFTQKQVVEFAIHQRGITVMVEDTTSGKLKEIHAAGLLAADGIWSEIRTKQLGLTAPKYTGKVAWRGLLNQKNLSDKSLLERTSVWLDKDRHVVCYPVENGRYLNIVAITYEPQASENAGLTIPKTEIARRFSGANTLLKEIFASEIVWTGWPLYATNSVSTLSRELVTLLGDAAHPMVPFAAQGGAMAIEDAAVIGKCLEEADTVEEAFSNYERRRKKRVNKIMAFSRNNGDIYHMSGITAMLRNIAMFLTPSSLIALRQRWIYRWRP